MIGRCMGRSKNYEDYRGRGIIVCPEWRDDFQCFYEHVGPRPSPRHSLDRINNDKSYEPNNVRWATKKEQSNNRRQATAIQKFSDEDLMREVNRRGLNTMTG